MNGPNIAKALQGWVQAGKKRPIKAKEVEEEVVDEEDDDEEADDEEDDEEDGEKDDDGKIEVKIEVEKEGKKDKDEEDDEEVTPPAKTKMKVGTRKAMPAAVPMMPAPKVSPMVAFAKGAKGVR